MHRTWTASNGISFTATSLLLLLLLEFNVKDLSDATCHWANISVTMTSINGEGQHCGNATISQAKARHRLRIS